MKIPKTYADLRRYVLRRDLLRCLGFVLWVAVLLGGVIAYNNDHKTYPDYRRMVGWKFWLFAAVAVISGVLIFKMWRLVLDRPCTGTVTFSGLSHTYTTSPDPGTGAGDYDFRTHTTLRIRTPDGKLRRLRFEQKNGFYLYYHEGERIAKFRGLPYPLNLDPTAKHGCVCSACGTHTPKKIPLCPVCGLSMMDAETFAGKSS